MAEGNSIEKTVPVFTEENNENNRRRMFHLPSNEYGTRVSTSIYTPLSIEIYKDEESAFKKYIAFSDRNKGMKKNYVLMKRSKFFPRFRSQYENSWDGVSFNTLPEQNFNDYMGAASFLENSGWKKGNDDSNRRRISHPPSNEYIIYYTPLLIEIYDGEESAFKKKFYSTAFWDHNKDMKKKGDDNYEFDTESVEVSVDNYVPHERSKFFPSIKAQENPWGDPKNSTTASFLENGGWEKIYKALRGGIIDEETKAFLLFKELGFPSTDATEKCTK